MTIPTFIRGICFLAIALVNGSGAASSRPENNHGLQPRCLGDCFRGPKAMIDNLVSETKGALSLPTQAERDVLWANAVKAESGPTISAEFIKRCPKEVMLSMILREDIKQVGSQEKLFAALSEKIIQEICIETENVGVLSDNTKSFLRLHGVSEDEPVPPAFFKADAITYWLAECTFDEDYDLTHWETTILKLLAYLTSENSLHLTGDNALTQTGDNALTLTSKNALEPNSKWETIIMDEFLALTRRDHINFEGKWKTEALVKPELELVLKYVLMDTEPWLQSANKKSLTQTKQWVDFKQNLRERTQNSE